MESKSTEERHEPSTSKRQKYRRTTRPNLTMVRGGSSIQLDFAISDLCKTEFPSDVYLIPSEWKQGE
ncbi:hypothetical protein ACLOJK_013916 [Asimina triloba]